MARGKEEESEEEGKTRERRARETEEGPRDKEEEQRWAGWAQGRAVCQLGRSEAHGWSWWLDQHQIDHEE
jgi:hypothetical protein